MSSHLSLEDRWAIVALHKHIGWKQAKIAAAIKCSQSEVSRLLAKYKETGDVTDLPKSGRKRLLEEEEESPLSKEITEHRQHTSAALRREILSDYGVLLSARTVRRLRKELGFRAVHYHRVPSISKETAQKRLLFTLDEEEYDLTRIIYTDESLFEISTNGVVYWKRPGEEAPVVESKQFPESVMVWGGVFWEGRTELQFIEGTINAKKYQDILRKGLLKPYLIGNREVLQDRATVHTAESTEHFADTEGIELINLPAHSPDLNPIETVWGWMKHKINEQMPQNKEELKQLIQRYWKELPQSTIQGCIQHLHTQFARIIESRGEKTGKSNNYKLHFFYYLPL